MSQRGKGKAGELEAAHLLADWWRPVEADIRFVRTPSSGGWATAKVRGEYFAAGDLMTSSRRWPFTVEVKRREAWSLAVLLEGLSSPVWGWWEQCAKAAREEARHPLLLFRHNRNPWFAMVSGRLGELALSRPPVVKISGLATALYRWRDFELEGASIVASRLATMGSAA